MEVLAETVMMNGVGQILGVLAHHIEEADVRQRLVRMAQRLGGYKGAMRNATMAASRRVERTTGKDLAFSRIVDKLIQVTHGPDGAGHIVPVSFMYMRERHRIVEILGDLVYD